MAAREDIRLEVVGDIQAYAKAVGKIPGVTEKEAEKAAKRFVDSQKRAQIRAALEAEKAAKESSKNWADAGLEAAKGFAAGFTAVAGVIGTVGAFVDQVADARLEIDGLSRATGIGLDTLSGLKTAADLAGTEFDDVAGGLEDFGEKMFDASRGSGAALEAFELLGFTQEELKDRLDDTDGVLREVIVGMQGTEDAALRNTLQQQLWGDAGNRLAEVLGDVPLEDFIDKADRLGNDVTPANVEAARAWKANLQALKGELVGTATALADFLDFSDTIQNATLGFVFLKNVGVATLKELADSWLDLALAAEAFVRGDFATAASLFDRATGFDALSSSIDDVRESALKETKAFFDLREEAKKVGTETKATKTELAQLSEEKEKAAKASKDLAREEAKLAKEQEKAAESLRQIQLRLTEDTLSEEEKILRARDEQLLQLGEIQDGLLDLVRAGKDVGSEIEASILASNEAVARSERDLARLRAEQAEERLEAEREFAEEFAELELSLNELAEDLMEQRRDRALEALDTVMQFQAIAFDGLTELNRRAQDATKDALDEQRDANATIREERKELKAQLLEDISEEERAAIESQIARLDAELEAGKASRKEKKENALKAWKAGQGLALADVAFNTSAAVMKAFALFGPPPSPAGIASAAAAGTNAAVQTGLILSEKPPQFHDGFDGSFPVFTRGPDERSALLRNGEPVLNSRAADNLGRENIQRLNQTGDLGGGGGGGMIGLYFDGRQFDELMTRTLDRGGRARRRIASPNRSRPSGQVSVFSASR